MLLPKSNKICLKQVEPRIKKRGDDGNDVGGTQEGSETQ